MAAVQADRADAGVAVLSAVLVAGQAAGEAAAGRARDRPAAVLRAELPEVAVTVQDEHVVLSGRVTPDDPRLRWVGSLLR